MPPFTSHGRINTIHSQRTTTLVCVCFFVVCLFLRVLLCTQMLECKLKLQVDSVDCVRVDGQLKCQIAAGFPSEPEMYREQSFSSTQTGSWETSEGSPERKEGTLPRPRTWHPATRDYKLKMMAKTFLQANGFMHINEAQHSWGRTRILAEKWELHHRFRAYPVAMSIP